MLFGLAACGGETSSTAEPQSSAAVQKEPVADDNTVVEETQSLIVNPNISGIGRTWGAIKAMFR